MKYLKILFLISNLILIGVNASGAEYEHVSQELVADIVLDESQKVFGNAKIVDVATYYNVDGEPEIYCFTLFRKDDSFVGVDALATEIENTARSLREHKRQLHESSSISNKENLKQRIETLRNEIIRKEEFITVFAAAHEGHQPVIKMHAGLPPHITLKDAATHMAKEANRRNNLKFKRMLYFDMMSTAFEFEKLTERVESSIDNTESTGEQATIVDPLRNRMYSKNEVQEHNAQRQAEISKKISKDQTYQQKSQRLRDKWKNIRSNHNNKMKQESFSAQNDNNIDNSFNVKPVYREIVKRK